MSGEHKSYGYEGGYEDWTADKVVKNMRFMQDGKQVADIEETEDNGTSSGDDDYISNEDKGMIDYRDDEDGEEW